MIVFLTVFSAIGGMVLGYGIVGMRVREAERVRDSALDRMNRMRTGELNIMGFSEGSAASWKKSCLEAQQATVDARREANWLREELDLARISWDDPVLPELVSEEIDAYWLPDPRKAVANREATRPFVSHRTTAV